MKTITDWTCTFQLLLIFHIDSIAFLAVRLHVQNIFLCIPMVFLRKRGITQPFVDIFYQLFKSLPILIYIRISSVPCIREAVVYDNGPPTRVFHKCRFSKAMASFLAWSRMFTLCLPM